MLFQLKKLSFIIIHNLALFFILFIGIQNSSSQKKVDLIIVETVNLPVSFIIGLSFISGSITGSLLTINKWNKK